VVVMHTVMHTVILAYHEFSDIEAEQQVIAHGNDAHIEWVDDLSNMPLDDPCLKTASALMVSIQKVSAELIEAMPNLKIISRAGTGLDNIDIAAATSRGVWVTNVPDYSVDEVSTHAISLLLAHARRLIPLVEQTRGGTWNSTLVRPFPRLNGQTLGVVGFGRIARSTTAKARGLGLNVLAVDPYVSDETIWAEGARPVDLDTLLRESDYITLHVPLTDETRGIINADTLAKMKPTAYLINTARGALVDESALLEAVMSGTIAGAALDVLNIEPPPPDHPFLREGITDRIVLTPHIGWYSEQSTREVRTKAAQNVLHALRGERPPYAVNAPVGTVNG
jgi:D-3-phosphoglycerate dehydrogenase / 2-oxoglutarate reductase